jgi:hypothetical protein
MYNYFFSYLYHTSNFRWLLKSTYIRKWHSFVPTIPPHFFNMRILWCQQMPPTICFWHTILLLSRSLKIGLPGLQFYWISLKIALRTMTGAPGKISPIWKGGRDYRRRLWSCFIVMGWQPMRAWFISCRHFRLWKLLCGSYTSRTSSW